MDDEVCGNATIIQVQEPGPFLYTGSTSQASPVGEGSPATACSHVSAFTRGAWYNLEGDGRCYTASTQGSTFDTVLAVYSTTAGCEELSCLAENDQFDFSSTSQVSWATSVGVDYYIFLAGYLDQIGDYTLSITVSVPSCIR